MSWEAIILLLIVIVMGAVLVIKLVFASKTLALFPESRQKAGTKKEKDV